MARDEKSVSNNRRTRSVPNALLSKHICANHSKTASTSTTASSIASAQTYPHFPKRSSSLSQRREATLATLTERKYQPFPPAHNEQQGLTGKIFESLSKRNYTDTVVVLPPVPLQSQRFDTPPPSDDEDDRIVKTAPVLAQKKTPVTSYALEHTVETSHGLFPLPGRATKRSLEESDKVTRVGKAHKPVWPTQAMRKALSTSSLATRQATLGEVLDEPTFGDFLALSDDDIAESRPSTPSLIPNGQMLKTNPTTAETGMSRRDHYEAPVPRPIAPSCPSSGVSAASSDTSASSGGLGQAPSYRRAGAAAAFEAARIASRYGFDLVYVISLWPKRDSPTCTSTPLPPSNHSQSCSRDSGISHGNAITNNSSGMSGRLMAAFGLNLFKSPFKIATAVHLKILQNKGWIEYRNSAAKETDFIRGYACSFNVTNEGCRGSEASASAPQNHQSTSGIVFAAYKRPRSDVSSGCGAQELAQLHEEARKLVDMLIESEKTASNSPSKSIATYSPFPPAEHKPKTSVITRRPSTAKTVPSVPA